MGHLKDTKTSIVYYTSSLSAVQYTSTIFLFPIAKGDYSRPWKLQPGDLIIEQQQLMVDSMILAFRGFSLR